MDEEYLARLALNRIAGVGPALFSGLIDRFGCAVAVFNANRTQISAVPEMNSDTANKILKGSAATGVDQDLQWIEESTSHDVVFLGNKLYPEQLARISRPPPVLFLNGNLSLLSTPQLSIVGSRNPTAGGLRNAAAFSCELANSGLTITSGLASGIDGAAHKAALRLNNSNKQGKTIAVAATGLDRIYPSQHRELAHEIVEKGLMVSEFPIGTGPLRANFPRRNRVISGLSLGTLVVEAAIRSGSLISARYAVEQGREVFAIPGSIHSPQSRGCHWLIKQGAKLVETSDDIAEELLLLLPVSATVSANAETRDMTEAKESVNLSSKERQLVDEIGFDPITVDGLVEQTGMEVTEISALLCQLEVKKVIETMPGGKYCRTD